MSKQVKERIDKAVDELCMAIIEHAEEHGCSKDIQFVLDTNNGHVDWSYRYKDWPPLNGFAIMIKNIELGLIMDKNNKQ